MTFEKDDEVICIDNSDRNGTLDDLVSELTLGRIYKVLAKLPIAKDEQIMVRSDKGCETYFFSSRFKKKENKMKFELWCFENGSQGLDEKMGEVDLEVQETDVQFSRQWGGCCSSELCLEAVKWVQLPWGKYEVSANARLSFPSALRHKVNKFIKQQQDACDGKVVVIDGKEYTLKLKKSS